jgi:hypothetical protein
MNESVVIKKGFTDCFYCLGKVIPANKEKWPHTQQWNDNTENIWLLQGRWSTLTHSPHRSRISARIPGLSLRHFRSKQIFFAIFAL